MGSETGENMPGAASLVERFRCLLGAGGYVLALGFLLEGLAVVARRWISIPVSLAVETQILLTVSCVILCLLGVLWFYRSLNLIKVHLLNGRQDLVTSGPFAYVRHPLYGTLLMTIPPLAIVWFSDLLFFIPWGLLLSIAHSLVRLEERGLIRAFGEEYERYRQRVPALLPYRGAAGRDLRSISP
jgi:protein-S-isoprenylcysteine O-methyltransferase Ste14